MLIHLMDELCLRVLDGFVMPVVWTLCVVVQIFQLKGDIRNCCCLFLSME